MDTPAGGFDLAGHGAKVRKTIFVVSPIGDDNTPVRGAADAFSKHLVKHVAVPLGYECVRADEISKSGVINNQIIRRLIDSEIVVADLTGLNPNVFYELAICHAVHRPFVHMIAKGTPFPAVVAGLRAIVYDIHDLDSVEAAASRALRSDFEH